MSPETVGRPPGVTEATERPSEVDVRKTPGVFEYDLKTLGVFTSYGRGVSQLSGPLTLKQWLGFPHVLADPATVDAWGATEKGRAWFNSTENKFRFWDGTNILTLMALAPGVVSLTEGAIPFGAADGNLAENPTKLNWTEATTLLTVDNAKVLTNLTLSALTSNSIPYIGASGLVSQNNTKLFWTNAATLLTVDNAKVLTNLTLPAFTAGSVPYIGADGLVSQDNANLYWDASSKRFGIGGAPEVDFDLGKAAQATVISRISAKTRPWHQWECVDGNWGYAFGIDANDKQFYINYEAPIGTPQQTFVVFKYGGAGVDRILPQCDVIMPNNIALRWFDTDGTTARNVLVHDILGNIIIGVDGDDARVIIERLDTSTAANTKYSSRSFELMANYWTGTAQQQRGVKFVNTMVTAGAAPKNQLKISIGKEYSETLVLTLENDNETLTASFEGSAAVFNKAGAQLQFVGTAGGGSEGILYKDSGGVNRFGLLFPGSNVVALVNRTSNGAVQIRANTSTAGSGGEITVATFEDDVIYLNGATTGWFACELQRSGASKASFGLWNTVTPATFGANDLYFSTYDGSWHDMFAFKNNGAAAYFATGINLGLGTILFGTSAVGVFALKNQTAPAGNVTDVFQMYSADFAAGNACPYFRTENGTIIGLNQSVLTTDSPTFVRLTLSQGAGTSPFVITSTTVCTNLNSDLLDGQHATAFAAASHTHGRVDITDFWGSPFWSNIPDRPATYPPDTHYHTFLSLTDTPANYTGAGGKLVAVKATEDGLEFVVGGGGVTDHGALTGLEDDDHAQYALLAGRAGGQTIRGSVAASEDLSLDSTAHATKGYIRNLSNYFTDRWLNSITNTFFGVAVVGSGGLSHTADDEGWYNTALGCYALSAITTGYRNVAIGYNCLRSLTTGAHNVALGTFALDANTSGGDNFGLGNNALFQNTTGYRNVAIGSSAMQNNSTGRENVALGHIALVSNTTGVYNVAIGSEALRFNNTGGKNIAIGAAALQSCKASDNVVIGVESGIPITDGTRNVGVGGNTLALLTTGSYMIAVGWGAATGAVAANGPKTDTYGLLIGYNANRSVAQATQLTNYIGIGYGVLIDKSDQIKIGNASITEAILYGSLQLPTMKAGADQAAAGTVAGELWKTSGHATLPDNVVMHGV